MDNKAEVYVGENIRYLREYYNLNQLEFGKIVDKSNQSVSNWESGKKSPRMGIIQKLADYYSLETSDFFINNGIQLALEKKERDSDTFQLALDRDEKELLEKYRALDISGKRIVNTIVLHEYERVKEMEKDQQESEEASASRFQITYIEEAASAGFGEVLNNQPPVNIWVTVDPCGADFAIPVSGDSMEPEFFHDDVIYIKKQDELEPGEIGVFIMNGTGYVKKFETQGGKRLVSLNPKYPDIQWNEYDDIRVVGKVTGKTTKAEIEYC